MHWIAPSEKDTTSAALETRLWATADQFRANSGLKSQEYSAPVLGLIFDELERTDGAGRLSRMNLAADIRHGGQPHAPHRVMCVLVRRTAVPQEELIHSFTLQTNSELLT